jgi:hypothetical protein
MAADLSVITKEYDLACHLSFPVDRSVMAARMLMHSGSGYEVRFLRQSSRLIIRLAVQIQC